MKTMGVKLDAHIRGYPFKKKRELRLVEILYPQHAKTSRPTCRAAKVQYVARSRITLKTYGEHIPV